MRYQTDSFELYTYTPLLCYFILLSEVSLPNTVSFVQHLLSELTLLDSAQSRLKTCVLDWAVSLPLPTASEVMTL